MLKYTTVEEAWWKPYHVKVYRAGVGVRPMAYSLFHALHSNTSKTCTWHSTRTESYQQCNEYNCVQFNIIIIIIIIIIVIIILQISILNNFYYLPLLNMPGFCISSSYENKLLLLVQTIKFIVGK